MNSYGMLGRHGARSDAHRPGGARFYEIPVGPVNGGLTRTPLRDSHQDAAIGGPIHGPVGTVKLGVLAWPWHTNTAVTTEKPSLKSNSHPGSTGRINTFPAFPHIGAGCVAPDARL